MVTNCQAQVALDIVLQQEQALAVAWGLEKGILAMGPSEPGSARPTPQPLSLPFPL